MSYYKLSGNNKNRMNPKISLSNRPSIYPFTYVTLKYPNSKCTLQDAYYVLPASFKDSFVKIRHKSKLNPF
eukprot:COSAG01_NODE_2312_length_7938_cov_4.108687_8_plen_71_part_00